MVVIASFESLNIFIVRPFLDCFYSILSQRLILAVGSLWEPHEVVVNPSLQDISSKYTWAGPYENTYS